MKGNILIIIICISCVFGFPQTYRSSFDVLDAKSYDGQGERDTTKKEKRIHFKIIFSPDLCFRKSHSEIVGIDVIRSQSSDILAYNSDQEIFKYGGFILLICIQIKWVVDVLVLGCFLYFY